MIQQRESAISCNGMLGALIDARGGSDFQLATYVAVARGLRPALDDFVPVRHFERFIDLMRQLRLTCRPDVVFGHVNDENRFPSLRYAPTTKAIGLPWEPRRQYAPTCEVHVFVGCGVPEVDAAWRSGWYPVVVQGRIVQKPKVDHVRFGRSLGYPDCCIDAFARFNRWGLYDHISEAGRVSQAFPFVNNCFAKYTPYMVNFHIPCQFDCAKSAQLGNAIFDEVTNIDPRFAARMQAHLLTPVLHVSERLNFGLINATRESDSRWRYEAVVDIYALITGRDRRHNVLKRLLEWGTLLQVTPDALVIWNTAGEQREFNCAVDEGVIENPTIFSFQTASLHHGAAVDRVSTP